MEKPIINYIRQVLEKSGLNQSQFAEKLGVSRGEVTVYLNKSVVPNDGTCRRLAELSGDPPEKVLLLAAESRAPEALKPIWHNILRKMAKSGVFTLLLMVFLSQVFVAEGCSQQNDTLSIMRHKLEHFLKKLLGTLLAFLNPFREECHQWSWLA